MGHMAAISLAVRSLIGHIPWNLYSLWSLMLIAGLTHVPHIYLYTSTALRTLNPELEEAARTAGARPWQVALSVSLPLIRPATLYGAAVAGVPGVRRAIGILRDEIDRVLAQIGCPNLRDLGPDFLA